MQAKTKPEFMCLLSFGFKQRIHAFDHPALSFYVVLGPLVYAKGFFFLPRIIDTPACRVTSLIVKVFNIDASTSRWPTAASLFTLCIMAIPATRTTSSLTKPDDVPRNHNYIVVDETGQRSEVILVMVLLGCVCGKLRGCDVDNSRLRTIFYNPLFFFARLL